MAGLDPAIHLLLFLEIKTPGRNNAIRRFCSQAHWTTVQLDLRGPLSNPDADPSYPEKTGGASPCRHAASLPRCSAHLSHCLWLLLAS